MRPRFLLFCRRLWDVFLRRHCFMRVSGVGRRRGMRRGAKMMATPAGGHWDFEMGGARKGVVDPQDSFDFLGPLHSQRVNSGLVNGGKGRGPVDSRCELEGGSSALWKASHKADDPPYGLQERRAVVPCKCPLQPPSNLRQLRGRLLPDIGRSMMGFSPVYLHIGVGRIETFDSTGKIVNNQQSNFRWRPSSVVLSSFGIPISLSPRFSCHDYRPRIT